MNMDLETAIERAITALQCRINLSQKDSEGDNSGVGNLLRQSITNDQAAANRLMEEILIHSMPSKKMVRRSVLSDLVNAANQTVGFVESTNGDEESIRLLPPALEAAEAELERTK